MCSTIMRKYWLIKIKMPSLRTAIGYLFYSNEAQFTPTLKGVTRDIPISMQGHEAWQSSLHYSLQLVHLQPVHNGFYISNHKLKTKTKM